MAIRYVPSTTASRDLDASGIVGRQVREFPPHKQRKSGAGPTIAVSSAARRAHETQGLGPKMLMLISLPSKKISIVPLRSCFKKTTRGRLLVHPTRSGCFDREWNGHRRWRGRRATPGPRASAHRRPRHSGPHRPETRGYAAPDRNRVSAIPPEVLVRLGEPMVESGRKQGG